MGAGMIRALGAGGRRRVRPRALRLRVLLLLVEGIMLVGRVLVEAEASRLIRMDAVSFILIFRWRRRVSGVAVGYRYLLFVANNNHD